MSTLSFDPLVKQHIGWLSLETVLFRHPYVKRSEMLTTTSLESADVIRLSSQYNHPPREEINAVSTWIGIRQCKD